MHPTFHFLASFQLKVNVSRGGEPVEPYGFIFDKVTPNVQLALTLNMTREN